MLHLYNRRLLIFDDSDSSDDDMESRSRRNILPRTLRDKTDPFSMPEPEFTRMFRMRRAGVRDLLEKMLQQTPSMRNVRASAIPFQMKLLGALNFFGHGSYQKPTGENRIYCQSQASMSRSIELVVSELLKLTGEFIRFPTTAAEVAAAKADFMRKLKMPGIVCAIDGTNYPGSVHDSAIWQMSNVEDWMPDNAYMLGDSGFPSNRHILTPSNVVER